MLPDPGASAAVLIGTSTYEFLVDLPAVANNLSSLAETLRGPASWNLRQDNCTVLADPASGEAVMDALRDAAATTRDTLLVYYAGHGLVDPEGELYLGLPRSRQQRVETGISYKWVRSALLEGMAERTVVILDCCYSGLALGMMGSSDLAAQADVEGTYLLAAASETRQALAPPGETHTAFTGELLGILDHGIAGGPEKLDLDSVFRQLRTALTAKGRPVPQGRGRNSNGRLALGWNAAFSRSPLAADASDGRAELRSWPDPEAICTAQGFLEALGQVRIVSGLTHAAVSLRSGGGIAAGTVSGLLNRKDLPKTWKTTGIYLAACGVPDERADGWRRTWERLRAQTPATGAASPALDRGRDRGGRAASVWSRVVRRRGRD
ncbi:caspase family protein [Streptomyces angustmyceticus]|uniref:caspase family protein n=1 Tax=Streptomyces angustmyceticus TaxID=285578 RepID=UPI001CBF54A2|nr:caspase family protein [Streptomyces angustmyceticus]